MPDVTWTLRGIESVLDAIPVGTRTILDVGCGRGIVGALCRIYRNTNRSVGLDAYDPYVRFCRHNSFYDEVIRCDVAKCGVPFLDMSFELATCVEVIEHLEKSAGERLLEELERVAARVILTTPGIYREQDAYDLNPWQRHLSKWRVDDFERRGYRVYGLASAKMLVHYPLLTTPLSPLLFRFPRLASSYLCVKDSNYGVSLRPRLRQDLNGVEDRSLHPTLSDDT